VIIVYIIGENGLGRKEEDELILKRFLYIIGLYKIFVYFNIHIYTIYVYIWILKYTNISKMFY